MRPTIILLVIFSMLMMSSCNYFKRHRLFSKDVDTVLDMTIQEPTPIVADTTPITSQPEFKEPVPQVVEGKYFMIVGSFQNQNLANLYADKIKGMGYQTQVIEASNGFFRVSAKSFSNFQQGVNEIDDFRSAVTERAWLHVKK
jgi:hypothetical protein